MLPGANPQVVESAVTDILEEELSTVEGLRTLTSGSQEQISNITLEFNLDRDVEAAAQDVRDKVSRVRARLPEDVEEPVVAKQEADANPFFWLALSGENYDLLQLSDIGDRMVKSRLQTLPGVGQARIFGERRFSMRVWLSASELAARSLTVQDVENAIRSRNVEIPGGRIESERREFTVRSLGELKTPAEFAELVVSRQRRAAGQAQGHRAGGAGPRGRAERPPLQPAARGRDRRDPAVQGEPHRSGGRDPPRSCPRSSARCPAGVRIDAAFDQSVYVKRSILEAQETLLLAGGLVVVIIFLFLRNLRATIIPGLAIPASIIATFAVMYFLGFSINNLTLLALTLAIGIVVDDAIIVLENAYRHQEELGEDPVTAAREGTREIGFAVVATTICLIAVFTPLAFLKGSTGRLFNEFGIAVAGSVAVSGLVALTLTPMLCAQILRVPEIARAGVPLARARVRCHGDRLRLAARPGAPGALGGGARRAGVAGRRRRRVQDAQARVHPAGGSRLVHQLPDRAGGLVAGVHRRLPAAGGGDPRQDRRDRELLQHREHRRRREPWHHLHRIWTTGRSGPARWARSSARCRGSTSGSPAFSRSPTTRRRSAGGARCSTWYSTPTSRSSPRRPIR